MIENNILEEVFRIWNCLITGKDLTILHVR